jgi:hypothetical protein
MNNDNDEALQKSLLDACRQPPTADESQHRLSFMVGFWARRVPDEMKRRNLYGPCGPLPSPEEADWVKQLQEGYSTAAVREPAATTNVVAPTPLPCITPAWEEINAASQAWKYPKRLIIISLCQTHPNAFVKVSWRLTKILTTPVSKISMKMTRKKSYPTKKINDFLELNSAQSCYVFKYG